MFKPSDFYKFGKMLTERRLKSMADEANRLERVRFASLTHNDLIDLVHRYDEALRFYAEKRHMMDEGLHKKVHSNRITIETWFTIEDGEVARKARS